LIESAGAQVDSLHQQLVVHIHTGSELMQACVLLSGQYFHHLSISEYLACPSSYLSSCMIRSGPSLLVIEQIDCFITNVQRGRTCIKRFLPYDVLNHRSLQRWWTIVGIKAVRISKVQYRRKLPFDVLLKACMQLNNTSACQCGNHHRHVRMYKFMYSTDHNNPSFTLACSALLV